MKDSPPTCSDLKSNTYFPWIKKDFCTSLQIKFSTSLQIKFCMSLQIKFSTSLQIKFWTSLQIKFCTSLQIKFCTSLQIKWPEILRIIIKLNYAVSKANPDNFTITIRQTENNGINLQTQFCTQFTFFCIMNKLKSRCILSIYYCFHIDVYIYTYTYTYLYIHIHIYIYIHIHIHIYIYIYIIHIYSCTFLYELKIKRTVPDSTFWSVQK